MKKWTHNPNLLQFRNAPPRASGLINSLRGMGYTVATAIADIIDNSISAKGLF